MAVFLSASIIGTSCVSAFGATVNMTLNYDGANHNYTAEEVKICVDGEEITGMDVPPVILNDRTLVPARAVFEKIGCDIAWNDDTDEVYIMHNTDLIVLKINSDTGYKNNEPFTMDTPAKIINDRTFIPVRAVSEAIGCEVEWDGENRIVDVLYSQEPEVDNGEGGESSESGDNTDNGQTDGSSENGSADNNTGGESENGGQSGGSVSSEEISVNGIKVPDSISSDQSFYINADSEITDYDSFLLDNTRLVVDIQNANMDIINTNITATNSSVVAAVRSGQNQTEPVKVTRIVFDLNSVPDYEVKLSSDKKSIIVSFGVTSVFNLNIQSEDGMDYINIYGDKDLSVETYMLTNPDRVVININNAVSTLDEEYTAEDCEYVQDVRAIQYDAKTVQIVADVKRTVVAEVIKNNGYTSICISKSSMDNVSYNASTHTLTLLNADQLSSREITHTDDYQNGKYTITLDGNYRELFGKGTINCDDEFLSSIKINNDENGNTYFEASENRIVAVKITDYGSTIEIKFVSPKEIYDKVVVIDAGHGKQDNGASANGLLEKNVNLAIVQQLYSLLEADPTIKVYATRLDDSYPANRDRAAMANGTADLFVSVHQNSNTSSTPNGTEVLYSTHANEVGAPSNRLTSEKAAQLALDAVVGVLGTTNRGIKVRDDLIVLNQTTVPAILVETCFISNPDDAAKMKSEQYINAVASALYSAIRTMLTDYEIR